MNILVDAVEPYVVGTLHKASVGCLPCRVEACSVVDGSRQGYFDRGCKVSLAAFGFEIAVAFLVLVEVRSSAADMSALVSSSDIAVMGSRHDRVRSVVRSCDSYLGRRASTVRTDGAHA